MRKGNLVPAIAMGALCVGLASSANAVVMVGTFEGTITEAFVDGPAQDLAGDFGPAGSLEGKAFTLTFTYDSAVGVRSTPGPYEIRNGGSYFGSGGHGPVISASLKINNITQTFNLPDVVSYVLAGGGEFIARASEKGPPEEDMGDYFLVFSQVGTFPNDLATPYALEQYCEFCGGFRLHDATGARTSSGGFNVIRATVVPQAVPEPAAWALLILGFGGVGATLRRRRAAA